VARIDLIDVTHAYGTQSAPALHPMSVTWDDGTAYALLGPSGCGKTTLLNIISGLVQPTRGKVLFDGKDVTSLPPQARNIAQVFQFPVIYDTMSVFDNLAFPLKNRGWQAAAVRTRVHEIAELLEMTEVLGRRASGLSADAKQKISLGRGLVRPDVAAVLFDEPLTVIDPHLKWLLRRKLKQIHQQLKLTLLYVTHDQVEALTFADTVVVMTQGEIVQTGSAQELFERPAHTFVGHFIGSPGMNFLKCEFRDDATWMGEHRIELDASTRRRAQLQTGALRLGIRPEFIECHATEQTGCTRIELQSVQPMGTHTMLNARVDQQALWVKTSADFPVTSTAWIRLPPERLLLYANERLV
jgi:glycerol transport system ATP-binding protein